MSLWTFLFNFSQVYLLVTRGRGNCKCFVHSLLLLSFFIIINFIIIIIIICIIIFNIIIFIFILSFFNKNEKNEILRKHLIVKL